MEVINTKDNNSYEVTIEPATIADIKNITKSKRFSFNWREPGGATTFKLAIKDTGEILGLMSITDRPEDKAIEINLLESSKENIGKGKEYANIAGCMIAYACREAFKKGYDGYVCLVPKTVLKRHYASIYGMEATGRYMFIDGRESYNLIQKHIGG